MSMSSGDEDEVDQIAQLKEIHDYIKEFDHNETVSAQQIFSPYVACNLSTLFGMKRFGGGEGYDKGIEKWKYFGFHFLLMILWGLGLCITLYCCGISVSASRVVAHILLS